MFPSQFDIFAGEGGDFGKKIAVEGENYLLCGIRRMYGKRGANFTLKAIYFGCFLGWSNRVDGKGGNFFLFNGGGYFPLIGFIRVSCIKTVI